MQTPQPSASTSQVQSRMTATRLSRRMEKETLASLNDRLAAYIKRNQQQEREKASLSEQLAQSEETMKRVREIYDEELVEARRAFQETAMERARQELVSSQLRQDLQDAKEKLDKKTKEAASASRSLRQLDAQFQDLTAQNNKLASERNILAAGKKESDEEVARLAKEVKSLRRQVGQETLLRTDLENQLKTKSEELVFRSRCHEQELEEIKNSRAEQIQEVDGRLQQEYELKLQQSIEELRAENEASLLANKEELDRLYEQKVGDMKSQLKLKEERLALTTERCDALTKKISTLESEKKGHSAKIKELERKLDADHARFAALLAERDGEIDRHCREKAALLSDNQHLRDTKVALDNEIGTYRNLLEGEEERLAHEP